MKPIVSYALCFLLLVSACSKKDSSLQDPFDPAVEKIIKDESYGTLTIQKADVYLPAMRGPNTKTMVLIHGGFWTGGDKQDMDTLIAPIRAADPSLAIVNVNYRLADGTVANQFPAQMNDFKLLLDYLDAHAATWHTSTDYALVGVSSGAHLAMVYAYSFDSKKQVKVLASVIGPTNFAYPNYTSSLLFQQLAASLLGKTWLQDSALHKSVSPVNLVKAGAPPTFLAYGGADPIVPVSNPNLLVAKLETVGIPYVYKVYPGESHDLSSTAILDIIARMSAFLKAYL